ncbi:leucine-rich repeat domain-containing protein [Oscillospiraceae bacterium MB08-C2-2]|nr:leucine-rich repeat domain-containing protein [Oscillospiraceae bacterium MB08-C2-2]
MLKELLRFRIKIRKIHVDSIEDTPPKRRSKSLVKDESKQNTDRQKEQRSFPSNQSRADNAVDTPLKQPIQASDGAVDKHNTDTQKDLSNLPLSTIQAGDINTASVKHPFKASDTAVSESPVDTKKSKRNFFLKKAHVEDAPLKPFFNVLDPAEKESSADTRKGKRKKIFRLAIGIGGALLLVTCGTAAFMIITADTALARLEKANELVEENELEKAIPAFNKVVEKDETMVEAYLGLADVGLALEAPETVMDSVSAGYYVTGDAQLKEKLLQLEALEDNLAGRSNTPTIPSTSPDITNLGDEASEEESVPVTPPPPTPVTVWSDKAFEQMIRLALDKGPNETITTDELAAIRSLKIVGSSHAAVNQVLQVFNYSGYYIVEGVKYDTPGEIRNLGDLAYFKGLTSLTISYNSIQDLSGLEDLSSLTTLGLYNNQITDLSPLAGLSGLKWLFLYNNDISELSSLNRLTALEELWLSNNQIADLSPIAGLANLRSLFLDGNQIADLEPLAQMSNLRILSANNNQITRIDVVAGLSQLTDVSFKGNNILNYGPTKAIKNVNQDLYFGIKSF